MADPPADPQPPPDAAEPEPPPPVCAQCGGEATERCAGCRGVQYCGRECQKAAWPQHRDLCRRTMHALFGGKQLASERDFVLEYWTQLLPEATDVAPPRRAAGRGGRV